MPDPVERDQHREVVRARLDAPVIAATPPDEVAETKELTGS